MKLNVCSALLGTSFAPRWMASLKNKILGKSSVHRKARNHNTWKEIKVVFSIRDNHVTGGSCAPC